MLLSIATFILVLVTACLVGVTAWMAYQTKKLADYNREIVEQNRALVEKNDALIQQNEKHHRERLRPVCFPMTGKGNVIAGFSEVMGRYNEIMAGYRGTVITDPSAFILYLRFVNKGLGSAINLRFHINNMHNQMITKDFLITHALPPGEIYEFLSEIPALNIGYDSETRATRMDSWQVVQDAYFIVCEYESMFSGETFHSIVAKGYRDPYLASDGKNGWRIHRPLTPPVEFKPGLDPAKPIWTVPPEDSEYPGAFLNFPQLPGGGAAN